MEKIYIRNIEQEERIIHEKMKINNLVIQYIYKVLKGEIAIATEAKTWENVLHI